MKTVKKQIRGLETAWIEVKPEKSNDQPVVFFMHGCPDDPLTWQAQIDHLSEKKYPIIAPWARGVGESAPSRDRHRYGFDAIALDHFEILRTFDPAAKQKVIVVGHDIGGIHAWNFARLLGGRLAGLILINAPELSQMARRLTQFSQVRKSWYIGLFQIPFLPEFLLKQGEHRLLERAQKTAGMPEKSNTSIIPFLAHYREAARAVPEALRQNLPLLTAPVLVLWGNKDPFLEPPTADELNRLASDVTLRVIEGGHWLHSQKPERVNQLIDLFISEKISRTQPKPKKNEALS